MAITTYAELKTAISNYLMRTDLDEDELIDLFEAEARTDYRIRHLTDYSLSITGDDIALPSDFGSVESWRLEDSTYRYQLNIVPDQDIGPLLSDWGSTGPPKFATIVGNEKDGFTARFSPSPDATYASRLQYWASLPALTAGATTNWLLTYHPNIYLYGCLKHSAPYLHEDERIATWAALYDDAVEKLHLKLQRQQFGGTLRMRARRVIGG